MRPFSNPNGKMVAALTNPKTIPGKVTALGIILWDRVSPRHHEQGGKQNWHTTAAAIVGPKNQSMAEIPDCIQRFNNRIVERNADGTGATSTG